MQEIVGYQGNFGEVSGDDVDLVGADDGRVYNANQLPITAFGVQSTGTVAAGATVTISVSPTRPIRPDQLVLDATVAAGFSIAGIRVGPHNLLSGDVPIPGGCFVATATGVRFKAPVTASSSKPYVITVTNNTAGALAFAAGVFGPSVG